MGCERTVALGVLALAASSLTWSQTPLMVSDLPVEISGTVPDEAVRSALVSRVMSLFGRERVVDHLVVGNFKASTPWQQDVGKLLPASIKQVSKGQVTIEGRVLEVQGSVVSESVRQQVIADLMQATGQAYVVKHQLQVDVPEQVLIDQALANRTVEFEPGSAVLTTEGTRLLDEMARTLLRFKGRSFELIGHTDGVGARASNQALSLARAESVKAYLIGKGLSAAQLKTRGMGADQPVASNTSEAGRAKNRRIEFKLLV
ncbi:MAG TPA: OmpA family protein [Aquabacterium sp.]|nr:OmpA family protein [Aquabacterium sp.]